MEQDGGDAAMKYDLLNLDISKFNPAEIPETEGLQNQKRLSLPLEYKWFEDVLSRAMFRRQGGDDDDDIRRWFEHVTTARCYVLRGVRGQAAYPYAKRLGVETFGKFMRGRWASTHTIENSV